MDELDISGKRYISTRRASREHGYHSDYMGQLIRSKKVAGQKVGRAWYIEEDSLNAYLGKAPIPAPAPVSVVEPVAAPAQVAEVAAPVMPPVAPVAIEPSVIEEAASAPEAQVQPIVRVAAPEPVFVHEPVAEIAQETKEDAQPIAVRIQPQAAEPAYEPAENKIYHPPFVEEHRTRTPMPSFAPPMQQAGGLRYAADEAPFAPAATHVPHASVPAYGAPRQANAPRQTGSFPFMSLSVVGIAAVLIAVFASNFVSATIVSEQGKSASVNYAIHW